MVAHLFGIDMCRDVTHQRFGVQFNPFYGCIAEPRHIFSTVGGNRVSIYECMENGTMEVLQSYVGHARTHCRTLVLALLSYGPALTDPVHRTQRTGTMLMTSLVTWILSLMRCFIRVPGHTNRTSTSTEHTGPTP